MYEIMIGVLEGEKVDLVNCRVVKEDSYERIPYEVGTVEVSNLPLNYLSKKGYFIDSSLNKVYRGRLSARRDSMKSWPIQRISSL